MSDNFGADDDRKYLVLTGSEQGLNLSVGSPTKFLDYDEAVKEYTTYVRECGNAAMFEVTGFCLIPVKSFADFNGDTGESEEQEMDDHDKWG